MQVWHNYGFDRHVLSNMGIAAAGFAGDTMHMARLADASRRGKKTYSLESLSSDKDVRGAARGGAGAGREWGGMGWAEERQLQRSSSGRQVVAPCVCVPVSVCVLGRWGLSGAVVGVAALLACQTSCVRRHADVPAWPIL